MTSEGYAAQVVTFAEANGYTPTQVFESSYNQVCTVLGINKNNPPDDFAYREVRGIAARELWLRKNDADEQVLIAKIKSKILDLVEMAGAEVQKLKRGESAEKTGWLITKE